VSDVDILFNTPASEGGRETWAAALLDLLDEACPPDDDLPARARLGAGSWARARPAWKLKTSNHRLVLVVHPPHHGLDVRHVELGRFHLGHTAVRARKGAYLLGWGAT
jgi:hypothetical protein